MANIGDDDDNNEDVGTLQDIFCERRDKGEVDKYPRYIKRHDRMVIRTDTERVMCPRVDASFRVQMQETFHLYA